MIYQNYFSQSHITPFLGEDNTTDIISSPSYLDNFKLPANSNANLSNPLPKVLDTTKLGSVSSIANQSSASGANITSPFGEWFDATRIITVLSGIILFTAGIFLLGKNQFPSLAKLAVATRLPVPIH